MKVVRLIRLEKTTQGLLGVLTIDDFLTDIKTLELDDTFVKQGCYECSRYSSAKYPDTFELHVPGHTAVLFHAGNTEADTKGCILLGSTVGKLKGERAVLNSGETFKFFMKSMEGVSNFVMFIENRWG
jgi:hypothetical protein